MVPMEMAAVAASPGLPAALGQAPSTAPQLTMRLLCVWLAGAGASALLLCLKQRAFTRALGTLRRVDDDCRIGARTDAAPVLVGPLGERMGVKVGDDVQLSLVVQENAS